MANVILAKTVTGEPGTGLLKDFIDLHKDELKQYHLVTEEMSVTARLNCKSWGFKCNLVCFFEDTLTGNLFKLSAFRSKMDESIYSAQDEQYNFKTPGIEGGIFELEISLNSKGSPKWISAKKIK